MTPLLLWACSAPLGPPYTVEQVTTTLQARGYTVEDLGTDVVGHGPELAAFTDRRCLRATRDGLSDVLCVWTCTTPSCEGVGARRSVIGEVYGRFEAEGSFLVHRACAKAPSRPAGFDCVRVRKDLGIL